MHRPFLPLSLVLLLLLAACGRSAPTRYYLLESAHTPLQADALPAANLRVAQVTVPNYLDRNGIVSRADGSPELVVSQFHAWAEPVAVGVRRLMQEGLGAPLLAAGVNVPAPGDDAAADYILFVDVQRLDGDFNASAVLEARWTLRDSRDNTLGKGIYADREEVPGTAYDTLAAAESRMLRRMADHLGQLLPPLLRKK
ncbi:MAG: membrane integrity-associated transporter subunit PqiC [Desulfovibrio desulfuricans]|nr:membrane integrity-associated transporter subunit PqiC [Desulfovibrio desulfuricans]